MLLTGSASVRAQRRYIYSAAAVCCIAAVALVTWAFWPSDKESGDAASLPTPHSRAARLAAVPDLSELRSVANKRLRRTLIDPPPKPKKPRPQPKTTPSRSPFRSTPRLNWRLIGTAIETGKSAAFLIDSRGNICVLQTGEALPNSSPDATVKRIEAERVVVSVSGRDVELKLPEPRRALQ